MTLSAPRYDNYDTELLNREKRVLTAFEVQAIEKAIAFGICNFEQNDGCL